MAVHERTESEWDELMGAACAGDATHGEVPEPAAALRSAVLARSTRVLRCRRRARRFTLVAALAACYAAGLASGRIDSLYAPRAKAELPGGAVVGVGNTGGASGTQVASTGMQGATAGLPGSAATTGATGSASARQTPESKPANYIRIVAEGRASADESKSRPKPPSRFEQLRRISDLYLYQHGDVTTAIRYYRKALDAATAEELAVAMDKDSWLLIALKQELLREREYESRST